MHVAAEYSCTAYAGPARVPFPRPAQSLPTYCSFLQPAHLSLKLLSDAGEPLHPITPVLQLALGSSVASFFAVGVQAAKHIVPAKVAVDHVGNVDIRISECQPAAAADTVARSVVLPKGSVACRSTLKHNIDCRARAAAIASHRPSKARSLLESSGLSILLLERSMVVFNTASASNEG